MSAGGKPEGWHTPFRKTSSALHMIGGVQIDLLALNIILSIAILCLALAVGGGRLLPLVVVAALQFWGLMKIFKNLHEDDEWWWEIARAQIALRVKRGWLRVRSNLMRVI